MTLYRVTSEKLETVPRTTFIAESLLERKDLQRLLRQNISPLGDDLLVVAEEYGEWEDSARRIDLLCLSKSKTLVVVEIKRTEDGGHMELQAVRYAAMVSSMTLDQVIAAYAKSRDGDSIKAREEVLDFLLLDDEDEAELTGDVRIVLVSANFSTELTTTVLWLNQRDLDITCIRLRPYRLDGQVLIDATQIIPLPEATDYEVKLRIQEKEKRKVVGVRQEAIRKFWETLIDRSLKRTQLLANRGPTTDHWLTTGIGRSGFSLGFVLTQETSQVECYIRIAGPRERSKAAFQALLEQKTEIEGTFGEPLDWQELPDRQGCRICTRFDGGWRAAESEWPLIQDRMIDAAIRLEAALKRPVSEVRV